MVGLELVSHCSAVLGGTYTRLLVLPNGFCALLVSLLFLHMFILCLAVCGYCFEQLVVSPTDYSIEPSFLLSPVES